MKIELFLNRTSHEQSTVEGDVAFNGWLHGPASGDGGGDDLLPLISLREEPWGGIFVYGPTGQVFAVDNEAYRLLENLKSAKSIEALRARHEGDVDEFARLLSANNIEV